MDILKMLIGKSDLSVSEAMQKIDNNSYGILFLVDDRDRVIGSITDGDIRRFLLAGGKMKDEAYDAANRNPKVALNEKEALSLYDKRDFTVIPVVDENKRVIDLCFGNETLGEKKHLQISAPVIINAGGRGARLDPFTRVLPKPLIPIGDIPIIELIMKEYQSYGCDVFHIIINYKKELIKSYFSDNDSHYNIMWYDEKEPLGTGGGLSLLRGRIHETFFFANCDVLLKADYHAILDFHKKSGNAITMVCAYKNINLPYGVVEIGKEGVIETMKEKPLISFLANTGIYVVEPEIIDDIKEDQTMGFPDIVEMERKKGRKTAVYPVSENEWMDMGQLPELEKMRTKLYREIPVEGFTKQNLD